MLKLAKYSLLASNEVGTGVSKEPQDDKNELGDMLSNVMMQLEEHFTRLVLDLFLSSCMELSFPIFQLKGQTKCYLRLAVVLEFYFYCFLLQSLLMI